MKEKTTVLISMKRSVFVLLLLIFSSLQVFAQKEISGKVVDEKGVEVIGATIKVKGTGIGTITDFNGVYTLKDVPNDAKVLEVTYVGMESQDVAITGAKADVTLKESSIVMKDFVATGYGVTKSRDVVTSIGSISADDIKKMPVSTVGEAMQGQLAGVTVTTEDGSPDANIKIRVRNGGSLTQSSDPLYIVDGFPVADISDISPTNIQSIDVLKDAASTAIYGAQGANGVIIITTKDPDEGNKDGGATNISVDYTGYMGWKNISKTLDVLDVRDYALLQWEWAYLKDPTNTGSSFNAYYDNLYSVTKEATGTGVPSLTKFLLDSIGGLEGENWQDNTFGRTGTNQNHSLDISGGNKIASFNASYNRIEDVAIMQESSYTRDNLSLKTKFKPLKGLTLAMSTKYTKTDVLGAGSNTDEDAGSSTQSRLRNAVIYTPITLLAKDLTSLDDEQKIGGLYDPVTTIQDNYRFKTDTRYTINGYIVYKFLKDYTFRSDIGYENKNKIDNRFYGPSTYYAFDGEGASKDGVVKGNSAIIVTETKSSKIRNANTFNYSHKFKGVHNTSLLLGEETVVDKGLKYEMKGYGYDGSYKGEEVFNYISQGTFFESSNYIDPTDNMLSFFGRANYDYKGKYYLTGTMRADASTRFSKANQWGYFPSFAGAWRLSDEKFIRKGLDKIAVSDLKLRFSYGTAGNNNVDLGYLHLDFLSGTSSYFTDMTTTLIAGGSDKIAANPNLKWETTTTRNLGLDYGFFKGRISGAFELYLNTTNDLILKYKLSSGYNYQFRNIGSTENKGMEFSVKAIVIDKKTKNSNYSIDIGGNISANRNLVTSLGGMDDYPASTDCFGSAEYITTSEYLIEVGKPMGTIIGYQTDGYYTTADFASYSTASKTWTLNAGVPKYGVAPFTAEEKPGLIKFKDVSGPDGVPDGIIDANDKVELGNTLPLYTGGFSIGGHFGNKKIGDFDFNANFSYSIGNDVLNLNKMDFTTMTEKYGYRNATTDVAYGTRYSLFDRDGTYLPGTATDFDSNLIIEGAEYTALAAILDTQNSGASIWSPIMPAYAVTDYAVEDGSYLRFSALTVGYSLPERLIKKVKLTKARVFFTASNLFIWTNYSGFDPEVDVRSNKNPLTSGVDFSAYPKSTAYNFGVNLSF